MTDTTGKGPIEARLLLGLGMLLFSIGQSLTFAIVAPMARQVGFAPQAFGIALTLASLPLVFSAPFWGRRSDVVGRKPVFIVGITGAALGTLLVALVLELGLRGTVTGMGLLVLFALARGSSGVAASAIYPASSAYIVDITDVRHRGQGLAIIGAANGMGSVLGPVMAGALAMFGPLVPMYVASAIGLAGAILAWRLLPVPPRHANPGKKVAMKITDPRLRPYIIMWFCFFLTFMALQLILGFYLQDEYGVTDPRDLVRQVSLMLISMAAMIVVVQIGVFQLIRIRPQILLRVLGPFFVLALAIIGLAPNLVVMATGFGVLGIAFACANPGINGCASMSVEPWEQGAAQGLLGAGNTLGAILGPLVGTQIYTHVGHHGPMLIGGIGLALLSVYAFTIKVPERSWGATPKAPAAAPAKSANGG